MKNAEGTITLSSLEKNPNSATYNMTQKNNRTYISQTRRQRKPQKETKNESWPAPKSSNSNMFSDTQRSGPDNTSLITTCQIVLVDLFHNTNPVYALLKDASDITFITTQMQEKLVQVFKTSLKLSTMIGRQVLEAENRLSSCTN